MSSSFSLLKCSVGLRVPFVNLCLRTSVRAQHSLVKKGSHDGEVPYAESGIREPRSRSIEDVNYPAIKPKYPPGKWGQMDYKYAWLWHGAQENQLQIPDVQGRIDALLEKELSVIVLELLNDHPSALQFRQYATKTELMPWKGVPLYNSEFCDAESGDVSPVVNLLKREISEFLLMENDILQRQSSETSQSMLNQALMRLISTSLITHLGKECPHLKTCQYDENVLVSSLWDRHGIERKRRRFTSDSDVYVFDTVQDQRIAAKGYFQTMLRSHDPLPLCVPREEGISVTSPAPQLKYKPSVYGHDKTQKKKLDSIVAGHRLGDPCEFGLVGMLSTCDTHSVEERIGAQTARDCRLAMGITMTFAWLAAQAANQGFSHLIDLTYPLTSQTVLTDGRVFSFLAYQLNTLELWKDDAANPMVNLCWHSKEMPLYHSVENGKVNELNEEVLQTLVKMFTVAPQARGYSMKPTVQSQAEGDHTKQDYVPKRVVVEEIMEEEQYIVS